MRQRRDDPATIALLTLQHDVDAMRRFHGTRLSRAGKDHQRRSDFNAVPALQPLTDGRFTIDLSAVAAVQVDQVALTGLSEPNLRMGARRLGVDQLNVATDV